MPNKVAGKQRIAVYSLGTCCSFLKESLVHSICINLVNLRMRVDRLMLVENKIRGIGGTDLADFKKQLTINVSGLGLLLVVGIGARFGVMPTSLEPNLNSLSTSALPYLGEWVHRVLEAIEIEANGSGNASSP